MEEDGEVGGKFMIVRRVKTVEARVETIRRVQFFDVDEASKDESVN